MSLPVDVPGSEALSLLSRFPVEFYECLYQRADALFELTDTLLCADGPVKACGDCLVPPWSGTTGSGDQVGIFGPGVALVPDLT